MAKTDETYKPEEAIYTPPQAATYAMNAVRRSAEMDYLGDGIAIPIIGVGLPYPGKPDDIPYVPRIPPGKLCVIIAQTNHGKTTFMRGIETYAAAELERLGKKDHIIIHVSVEETVEEQLIPLLAKASGANPASLEIGKVFDMGKLEAAAVQVGTIPIFRVGSSFARADDIPYLSISNMMTAIDLIASGNLTGFRPKIAGLFFDYLQAFPIDSQFRQESRDQQRRLQVRYDTYQLFQACKRYGAPVFVNVQARQKLNGEAKPFYIPDESDGEETYSIGQRADRAFTLWMPKKHHPVGKYISSKDRRFGFVVQEEHMIFKVAKQRGPGLHSGKSWLLNVGFDDDTFTIDTDNGVRAGETDSFGNDVDVDESVDGEEEDEKYWDD